MYNRQCAMWRKRPWQHLITSSAAHPFPLPYARFPEGKGPFPFPTGDKPSGKAWDWPELGATAMGMVVRNT